MRILLEPLNEMPGFSAAKEELKKNTEPLMLEGCVDDMKCHLIACAGEAFPRKLIIAPTEARAREIEEDYRFFDRNVFYYPSKDAIFFEADVHSSLIVSQRLAAVGKLLDGEPVTVVASAGALLDKILPLDRLRSSCLDLKVGDKLHTDHFAAQMTAMGFERTSQVEQPGQFSIRGGIIDFYNLCDEAPFRIELWDEEIDSIRIFDAESQRTVEMCESTRIYPASEYILGKEELEAGIARIRKSLQKRMQVLENDGNFAQSAWLKYQVEEFCEQVLLSQTGVNADSYLPFFFDQTVGLLDYFAEDNCLIIFDEPARIEEEASSLYAQCEESMMERLAAGRLLPEQASPLTDSAKIMRKAAGMRLLLLASIPAGLKDIPLNKHFAVSGTGMRNYRGNFSLLVRDLESALE